MPLFTEESLNQLRQRIDLVEVLAQHLDLKRSGAAFKALCPFHDEKTPSFIVHKGDHHYHCFGCGAHGDAIGFLMSYLKMSFSEAVAHLGERFGVALEKKEGVSDQTGELKIQLRNAIKEASRFYHFYLLHTQEGHEALNYLYERGIDLDFIHLFQIGFSPKHPGIFSKIMESAGFSSIILEQAGLIAKGSSKNPRDFFSNRVMFPIKDALGHIAGFSARKIDEKDFGPKYINTSETPLFKKSHLLFGLSDSRRRIAKDKKAILVEGQIDTLRLIQEGFNFTVAGQGTAFTQDHAQELIKLGIQEVFIAFDGDDAGRNAAIKVGDFFQKEGIEVKVVSFLPKEDPDLVLREKGPSQFIEYLEKAKGYLEFLVENLSLSIDRKTPSGKHQLTELITTQIEKWNHPVMIHESLKKLAKILEVPQVLVSKTRDLNEEVTIKKRESLTPAAFIDPQKILEADFLRWLLLFSANQEILNVALLNITPDHLLVPVSREFYKIILELNQSGKVCDILNVGMHVENSEAEGFLSLILQKKVNGDKAKEGCIETIKKILERNWLLERERIKIKIHSGKCTDEEVMLLAKKFDTLKKSPPEVVLFKND